MVISLDTLHEPIGSIKPWLRATSPITVPFNYLVCDGSLVSDTASPFNGTTIPDFRARYPKGHSTGTNGSLPAAGNAGIESGGLASVNFNHNHNISGDGNHGHNVNSHTHNISTDGSHSHNPGGGTEFFVFISSAGSINANGSHSHGGGTGGIAPGTDSQGNHNHVGGTGGNLGTVALDPVFSGFVYIIRFK